jgi:hypothetical protein
MRLIVAGALESPNGIHSYSKCSRARGEGAFMGRLNICLSGILTLNIVESTFNLNVETPLDVALDL